MCLSVLVYEGASLPYPALPYPVPAGANLEVDVPWKYLNFFLDDDMRLVEIGREYKAGRMLTGEVKKELIGVRLLPPCISHGVFEAPCSASPGMCACLCSDGCGRQALWRSSVSNGTGYVWDAPSAQDNTETHVTAAVRTRQRC